MLCVYFGKKFIDVKNSCTVTSFSWDTELSSLSPPKFFIVTFVCIYLRVFFFLEKRKIGLLDIVEIENNKKRYFFLKCQCF